MKLEELAAREAIRDTIVRYNAAGDSGHLDELALCFSEDGELDLPGEAALRGRGAIVVRLSQVADELRRSPGRPLFRHHVGGSQITLTSETEARVRSTFLVVTEIGLDHSGRYLDRFRRTPGGWLIAQRRVRLDWASPDTRFPAARAALESG
jgi:hypothetical protein